MAKTTHIEITTTSPSIVKNAACGRRVNTRESPPTGSY